MKELEEIVSQDPIYINDWSEKFDVIADFEDIYMMKDEYEATESPYQNEEYWLERKEKMAQAIEDYKDINILFASYGNANYSGDAYVLFEEAGKLYEVMGGHCSCYGLEGQWGASEVFLPELENRLLVGSFGEDSWSDNDFKEELCEFLGVEFRRNS